MANDKFKNNEFQIMQEAWKVYTQFYEGAKADDDTFWDNCVNSFTAIQNKYKTEFSKDIVIAFLNDIERRSRTGK